MQAKKGATQQHYEEKEMSVGYCTFLPQDAEEWHVRAYGKEMLRNLTYSCTLLNIKPGSLCRI